MNLLPHGLLGCYVILHRTFTCQKILFEMAINYVPVIYQHIQVIRINPGLCETMLQNLIERMYLELILNIKKCNLDNRYILE